MNELASYNPTIDEKIYEAPETEEKEGAVEAFGRKLINESKICTALAEYIKQSRGESIPRVLQDPELKKIVREHSDEKNFISTLALTQEAIDRINTAREAIRVRIEQAKKVSEATDVPWENILTKKFFGLKDIAGEIEIIDSDFYLAFVTNTFSDFSSMHSGGAEGAMHAAGYSFAIGDMPYTVVKKVENVEATESTHSHEEQHILNSLILDRAESEIRYQRSDFQILINNKVVTSEEKLKSAVADYFTNIFTIDTKNEILAYFRDSQPRESLAEILSDMSLLMYYKIGNENPEMLIESEIKKAGLLDRGTMNNQEYVDAIMQLTEEAYEKTRPTVEGWVQDAEKIIKLLEKTERRQDIIFMLGLVPIKKWGRIAKIFEKIEQNKPAKDETNQAESHAEEIDLSLEMIKHETLTNETSN